MELPNFQLYYWSAQTRKFLSGTLGRYDSSWVQIEYQSSHPLPLNQFHHICDDSKYRLMAWLDSRKHWGISNTVFKLFIYDLLLSISYYLFLVANVLLKVQYPSLYLLNQMLNTALDSDKIRLLTTYFANKCILVCWKNDNPPTFHLWLKLVANFLPLEK